jgi:DNA polymerase-3 subunit gamma/tau
MTYTALYRRYRPDTFTALIGQDHIARVLSSAVRQGSFVHAYLFCGPRGTGKTSAARVLARAINCENSQKNGNPCHACPPCLRALDGVSMDIIEIDGASNRGIDEIRDLRERVKYAPAQEKYKIYIIDEVHMLTNDAFNAILKTLEEPPAHVVFVFATTAPHKLPLTVLSRCQRFDFRRIADQAIREHLLDIAKKEQIRISDEAAALIAKKADGGMRDAVSLLDQCAAAAERNVDSETVQSVLGIVDAGFISELAQSLLEKDIINALSLVEQLIGSGKDLRQALVDLLENLREQLLAKLADSGSSPYSAQAYLDLLTSLADVDNKLRFAASPRISLELALIKACQLDAAPKQPAAPKQQPAATKQAAAPKQPAAPNQAAAPKQPAAPKQAAAPKQPAAPKQAQAETPGAGRIKSSPAVGKQQPAAPKQAQEKSLDGKEIFSAALPLIEAANISTFMRVEYCRARLEDGVLLLLFPAASSEDYQYIMSSPEHLQVIENALCRVCGEQIRIRGGIGNFQTPQESSDKEDSEQGSQTEEQEIAEPRQNSLF